MFMRHLNGKKIVIRLGLVMLLLDFLVDKGVLDSFEKVIDLSNICEFVWSCQKV